MYVLKSGEGKAAIFIMAISNDNKSYALTGDLKKARRFKSVAAADAGAGIVYAANPSARGSLKVARVERKMLQPYHYLIVCEDLTGIKSEYGISDISTYLEAFWIRSGNFKSIYIKNMEAK